MLAHPPNTTEIFTDGVKMCEVSLLCVSILLDYLNVLSFDYGMELELR